MPDYKRNHYVPEWYQYRFLPSNLKEQKFFYLDLHPKKIVNKGHSYTRKALLRWGAPKCFCQDDLYTTKFGEWESREIEQYFFGNIDSSGLEAVKYFSKFSHPSVNGDALHALLPYMTLQKLRTPKGLAYLSRIISVRDKNHLLMKTWTPQKTLRHLFRTLA